MAHFYELSSCFKASLFQQPVQLFYCDDIYPLYASIYRVLKLLKTHTLLIICLAIEQFIVPCYVCLENLSMDMFFFIFVVIVVSSCLCHVGGSDRQLVCMAGRQQEAAFSPHVYFKQIGREALRYFIADTEFLVSK